MKGSAGVFEREKLSNFEQKAVPFGRKSLERHLGLPVHYDVK